MNKDKLRKIKKLDHPLTEDVRVFLRGEHGPYIQFAADVRLYGLYEAVLLAVPYYPKEVIDKVWAYLGKEE